MEDKAKRDLKGRFIKGNQSNLGKKKIFSEELKRKLSEAGKGRILPPEICLKISLAKKGKPKSEQEKQRLRIMNLGKKYSDEINKKKASHNQNHHAWKGVNVGYDALHQWINRHLPKPELCEMCHQKKKLDAACITGIYNRDFKNWKYICRKCHNYYDGTVYNLKGFVLRQ